MPFLRFGKRIKQKSNIREESIASDEKTITTPLLKYYIYINISLATNSETLTSTSSYDERKQKEDNYSQ